MVNYYLQKTKTKTTMAKINFSDVSGIKTGNNFLHRGKTKSGIPMSIAQLVETLHVI
jgi:hypothetical protein